MFCTHCGTALDPDRSYCPACGTPRPAPPGGWATPPSGPPPPVPQGPPPPPGPPAGPAAAPVGPGGRPPAAPPPTFAPVPPPTWTGPGAPPPAPTKPKRGLLAVVLVLVGVLALGGIAFAIIQATSGSSGGEEDPEAAARALAEAVAAEDPAAAIATMNPDEVRTLGDLYGDARDQAAELGFAGKGDNTFAGVDLTTKGLTYEVEELGPDVAKVTVTGGSIDYDVRRSRLAPKVQAVIEQQMEEEDADEAEGQEPEEPDELDERTTGSVTADDLRYQPDGSGPEQDPFLMMVKRDGGWYVSPMYTAAEYVAALNGLSPGRFDEEEDAEATAESPTEAVEQLSEAIADIDADAATAQLSDDELAILRSYRAGVAELIDQAFDEAEIRDAGATVESLELDEQPLDEGGVKVVVTAVDGTVTWTEDGEDRRADFTWDGRCLAVTGEDSDGDRSDSEDCITADTRRVGLTEAFLVAVEEDGGWRVSPVSTLLEYGRQILPKLDRPLVNRLTAIQHTDDAVGEVTPGEPLDAKLNDAGYAVYDLEVEEGDAFTYSVEEDDAYALVYDPDSQVVDSFEVVEAAVAGTYKVVIQQEHFDTGTATLTVQPVAEEDLTLGEPVEGELADDGEIVEYVFEAEADQELTIEVDNTDVVAELLDADREPVEETVDDTYPIEDDGEYRVRVSTFEETDEEYTLLVDEAFDFRLGDGTTDAAEGTITGPGSVLVIDLEVNGGATVDVVVTPVNPYLDVIVTVVDPDGTQTPYNSQGPGLDEGVTFFPDDPETFELRIAAVNNVAGDVTIEATSTEE